MTPSSSRARSARGYALKTFRYTGRSQEGTVVQGVVEANTQDEAIEQLKGEGLIVGSITESGKTTDVDLRLGGRRVKDKTLSVVCKQFAIILKAGIPIVRALQLVGDQTQDKTLKEILRLCADDVAAGYPLADSFEKHGSALPPTFIETIRAGESSGNLEVCFDRLASYYEKTSKTCSKVTNAMIYPIFVLIVAAVVVAVLMVFAVPTFKSTFDSMGQELPGLTKAMIATSDFFVNDWMVIVGAIAGVVLAWKVAKARSEDFRLWVARMATRLPVLGGINAMNATAQYAGTMAVMMQAGLPVVQAVAVTARSISNYYMATALAATQPDLEAGKPLGESMRRTEAFPDLVVEMTTVGEDTGSLESTLDVMSEYYDNEVANATQRALSILEPVTIVILGLIVGAILLAVYIPMFTLETSVQG